MKYTRVKGLWYGTSKSNKWAVYEDENGNYFIRWLNEYRPNNTGKREYEYEQVTDNLFRL